MIGQAASLRHDESERGARNNPVAPQLPDVCMLPLRRLFTSSLRKLHLSSGIRTKQLTGSAFHGGALRASIWCWVKRSG